MTMNKVNAPILAGLLFVSLGMFSLPGFAVQSTAPELQTEQQLSKKQLKYLLHQARTPADHLQIPAYYRQKAKQLRDRSSERNTEADGYANRSVFEPKTGIPGGLLGHCREWAWRYAEDARKAEAMAETHEKLAQEIHNPGENPLRQ
jgi:hypothetical protein